ncbi:MAG: hypothetical protein U0903_21020 [Planctomycetales bacterium]
MPATMMSVGALDAVGERFTTAVEVVELALGDGVVDVDGGDPQFSGFVHLVETVDAGGGFFADAAEILEDFGIAVVDDGGEVSAVIEDHVEGFAVRPENGLLDAPFVFFLGFFLPGEDGDARGGDGGGGVVLRGEDVAAGPADFGAEGGECFDEDGGLDGHVQTAGDAGARGAERGRIFCGGP